MTTSTPRCAPLAARQGAARSAKRAGHEAGPWEGRAESGQCPIFSRPDSRHPACQSESPNNPRLGTAGRPRPLSSRDSPTRSPTETPGADAAQALPQRARAQHREEPHLGGEVGVGGAPPAAAHAVAHPPRAAARQLRLGGLRGRGVSIEDGRRIGPEVRRAVAPTCVARLGLTRIRLGRRTTPVSVDCPKSGRRAPTARHGELGGDAH